MKSTLVIQIHWSWSKETVCIDPEAPPAVGCLFSTTEIWPHESNMVVTYSTSVIDHKKVGTKHVLRLGYSPKNNPSLADYDICWGTSTIEFDTRKKVCKATWANNPPSKKYDGEAGGTIAYFSEIELLEYQTTLRIKRRQYDFKRALLGRSATCELSGESEAGVLDAAHIVGVSELGNYSPENGLLLRADLHRLFDARLLHISPETGRVSLAKSVPKDSSYRQLLKGMKLKPEVLECVRASLLKRTSEV